MTAPCRHSWLVARLHEGAGRTWATYQCEHCGVLSEEQPEAAPASRGASWLIRAGALLLVGVVLVAAAWVVLLVAAILTGAI